QRAVLAACRAGLRVVDRHTAELAAWELQAGARGLAGELARLGLDAALAGGRPDRVLRWIDLHRAAVLSRPALLPPADPALAERLLALRALVFTSGGRPSIADQNRIVVLEKEIRSLDWCQRAQLAADRSSWDREELSAALGGRSLVSFVRHRDDLLAVSVVEGRHRLHLIGDVGRINSTVRSLRLALTFAAAGEPAGDAVAGTARELEELLFTGLPWLAGDRPLVIVPTGTLHNMPWAVLPSCQKRAVTVAPSVTSWLRASQRGPGEGDSRVWIAGPGLRHAQQEVRILHARHGGELLIGPAATVDRTMAAMDGADTVHIAAHARFRDDQPLFSAIRLADGALFGHDVARLRRPPRRIVLSACDSGRSAVRPGDEVMGFAAALLRQGTSTVIASVLPVPDDRAVGLVTQLHAGMSAGLDPAEALADATAAHGDLGFICLGSG
ncbi:MAG TPA: CHAT domain-containing protein, partial [Pseudonocardiaceae bacterium]